jgi:hypothetical protein
MATNKLTLTIRRPNGDIETVDATAKLANTRMVLYAYICAASEAMAAGNRGEIIDWTSYFADGTIEDSLALSDASAAKALESARLAQIADDKYRAGNARIYKGMDAEADEQIADNSPSHKQEED